MPRSEKYILWPGTFFLVGVIFALASPPRAGQSFAVFFWENVITSLSVGAGALVAGRYAYLKIRQHNSFRRRDIVFYYGLALIGGWLGRGLSLLLHHHLQNRTIIFDTDLLLSSLATSLITLVVASGALIYWHFLHRDKARTVESPSAAAADVTSLAFKENGQVAILRLEDIIYFTADGKQTLVVTHTDTRRAQELMGSLLERLPTDRFIRIHRKHVVNLTYLTGMEYMMGGNYLAYLKEDKEFALPVGRSFVKTLKATLRLN